METEKGYYGIVIYIHISSDMIETPVSCIKKRPGVKAEPFFFLRHFLRKSPVPIKALPISRADFGKRFLYSPPQSMGSFDGMMPSKKFVSRT